MKKVFGQTARNLKREVNKKVLKVSGIEQKILDATSNEPWGPHGTHLVELAQATRNNHDYQIIMSVIWKRINDTGKKWRHVFKALTVLEYLVAHGSERLIDEIRVHAYQISILAEFQYVDSGGRDQGINVRKKSQSLVALLNDKERIREVRMKAQTNKDKYGAPSTGGGYRQSAGGYDDHHDNDHYGNRTDERNGYRDDDRYGRGRNSDERYDRDANRDDNNRSRGNGDNQFRSRSRSVDGYADRSFGDDHRYSSRNGGGKADDQSQGERGFEPPSCEEEATKSFQDIIQDERNGEAVADSTQNLPSPIVPTPTSPSKNTVQSEETAGESVASQSNVIDTFDEFDPRGSASAVQPAASNPELDIFGFSASDPADPLALVPANSITSQSDTSANSVFGSDFLVAPSSAPPASIQTDEDPFGDAPFKAIPQENIQAQPQHLQHVTSFQPSGLTGGSETLPSAPEKVETFSSFDFGGALGGLSYAPTDVNGQHASAIPSFLTTEFPVGQSNNDILDSILPRTGSGPTFPKQEAQPASPIDAQTTETNPFQSSGLAASAVAHGSLTNTQTDEMNPFQLSGELTPVAAQGSSTHTQTAEMNPFQPFGFSTPVASQESPTVTQNLFPPSGLPAVAASQEPQTNMPAAQMNPPLQSGLLSPVASEGSPTNMQPFQMNFLQSSGPPASAVSQEPVTHMQTAQMNFSQASGLSVPAASNMQTSLMNFFQPSGQSAPVTSQESQMNMQTAQMNFVQPSGLSTTGASQGLNPHMQTDQLNFLQPSGVSAPAGFQGSQTHTQTAQPSFLAPSGLQSSAGLQGSQTHTQITRPSFLVPSGLQALAGLQGSQTHTNFLVPSGLQAPAASQGLQTNIQTSQSNFLQPSGQSDPVSSQTAQSAPPTNIQAAQPGTPANMQTANLHIGSQSMFSDPLSSQAATVSVVPTAKPQPSNAKFETKSTVWANTLSRGLVNLDISGPKTNPLADIGVDFDAINRREKRLEPKSSAPPVTSTIHMGKAMGSGSGIGRSAASGLVAPPSPMMGGMGMGMEGGGGMGMGGGGGMAMGMPSGVGIGGLGGPGMGMGGYGGNMNQPPMGMNMGMNMGMDQGAPMQPPGPGMPRGGYNPMMGMGGYGPQHQSPYGGGYR